MCAARTAGENPRAGPAPATRHSGDYSSYPPDFLGRFRRAPHPGEPRDVAVRTDPDGVIRVRWELDTRRSTPFLAFPASWKDAPR